MMKLFKVNDKHYVYNRTGKHLVYQATEPEYTVLDYLESTGTQWIDTEIPFQPIKAVIELCFNEDVNTRQAMGFASYNTTYFGKTSTGLFELGGGVTITGSNAYKWQEVEFTHNGTISPGICKLTVDGVSKTRQANIGSQPSNFWLFNIPGYGTPLACHCKIRKAQFYNPNTNELIGDFISVLDKNLVPCMYDKVNGKYHPNVGTGQFTYSEEA